MSNQSSSESSLPPSAQALIVLAREMERHFRGCDMAEADLVAELVALLSAQQEALAQCQKDRDGQAAREAAICREAAAALSAQEAHDQQAVRGALEAVHADFHRRIHPMITPQLNTPDRYDVLDVIGHANEARKAALTATAEASLVVHNASAEWAMVTATLDAEAAGVSPFDLREAARVATERPVEEGPTP